MRTSLVARRAAVAALRTQPSHASSAFSIAGAPALVACAAQRRPRLAQSRTFASEINSHVRENALFDVSHVTAIVTGGGSGIGLMIAQALQSNGAKVYITGRRPDALHRVVELYSTGPGKILPLHGDISKKDEVNRLVEQLTASEPNGIQLLVNNAGIARDVNTAFSTNSKPDMSDAAAISRHFMRSEPAHWAETFNTNVTAGYFMSMAFLPLLARGRQPPDYAPSVVNVSSVSGALKTSSGGQFSYAASKAAFTHLTRMLATTFKDAGVRVNGIAPGVFPSEMTAGSSDDAMKSRLEPASNNPAGRKGKDSDIAATILFLAGKGGSYYSDQILYPDGGNLIITPSA